MSAYNDAIADEKRYAKPMKHLRSKTMLTYNDAIADENLYATWLNEEYFLDDLVVLAAKVIHDGGYTVSIPFQNSLGKIPADLLAEFIAANTPYETDDDEWLAYCRATYPNPDDEPTTTFADDNGAMSSFRD